MTYRDIWFVKFWSSQLRLPSGDTASTPWWGHRLKLSKQRRMMNDQHYSTIFNNIQQCDMMRHEPEKHHFKVSNLCHASATCIRNMHPCFMVFLARPDHPQLLPASRCKSQCFTNCERLSICCGNVCQVCQGPTPFPSHVPPARPRCFITVTLRLHMLHFIIFISWN